MKIHNDPSVENININKSKDGRVGAVMIIYCLRPDQHSSGQF
jgi:hypothetical protein